VCSFSAQDAYMKRTGGGTKLVLSHNNCHQSLNLAIAGNHKAVELQACLVH